MSIIGRFALLRPEVMVKKLSPIPDLISGITLPKAFPWLTKPFISSLEALEAVRAEAPVDGTQVVDWMQGCAAINAALYGMMEDYNRLRPRLSPQAMIANSGDAYIPGVSLSDDFAFQSIKGEAAMSRGNVILMTPMGTTTLPVDSSQTIIGPNFLGWAVATGFQTIQWRGALVHWQELASKPVTQGVRCANVEGFVSPMFFDCPGGLIRNVTTVTITSDKPQTIVMTGLAPYDYTVKLFEFTQPIEGGQTEITYRVFGGPRATHHVLQITPENNTETIINSIE